MSTAREDRRAWLNLPTTEAGKTAAMLASRARFIANGGRPSNIGR